jgi:hypothetical protein
MNESEDRLIECKLQLKGIQDSLDAVKVEKAKALAEMAEIEKKIEEAKRPKLRHGDYGKLSGGNSYFFNDSHGCNRPSERPFGIGQGGGGQQNADKQNPVIFGNIFDDLKAISEPLEKFEIADVYGDKLIVSRVHNQGLHFNISSTSGCARNALNFNEKQEAVLITNLRRMLRSR